MLNDKSNSTSKNMNISNSSNNSNDSNHGDSNLIVVRPNPVAVRMS